MKYKVKTNPNEIDKDGQYTAIYIETPNGEIHKIPVCDDPIIYGMDDLISLCTADTEALKVLTIDQIQPWISMGEDCMELFERGWPPDYLNTDDTFNPTVIHYKDCENKWVEVEL